MVEATPEQIKKRLNELLIKEKDWFESRHNQTKFLAKRITILVLGDHPEEDDKENLVDEVVKKLRKDYYCAIALKEVCKEGNHLYFEKKAIEHYQIIIKLENREVSKPGAIGESVLITCNKENQEKTFLFVKESPSILKDVFLIDHYFLYFPRTYFCKDNSDMIDKSIKIAIREAFRLVYLSLNKTD